MKRLLIANHDLNRPIDRAEARLPLWRARNLFAPVAALALTTSTLLAPPASSSEWTVPADQPAVVVDDAAALDQFMPQLPSPEDIRTEPLVDGVVIDPDSAEPQEGALVTLVAWPDPEELAKVPVGGLAGTATIAKAVTDSDGAFELKIADSQILDQYVTDEGDVNLDVQVMTSQGVELHSLAATVDTSKSDGVVMLESIENADEHAAASITLEADDPQTPAEAVAAAEAVEIVKIPICDWRKAVGPYDVWSQFEHLASTTPDVQAYTKYSSGEVSTVGVGAGLDIKGNRWGGSLKQTGKTKMKSSATYIFNTKYGKFSSKFYRITQYYKWYYMCYADSLDKWLDSGNGFQMRPSGAIYGADERDGWSTPSATHCVPVTKAIVLKTREGSTFTEGADLKAWGFKANLSNMAGRTSGLYVDYRTRPGSKVTKFQLCGTTGKPGLDNNSGALVAKAAK